MDISNCALWISFIAPNPLPPRAAPPRMPGSSSCGDLSADSDPETTGPGDARVRVGVGPTPAIAPVDRGTPVATTDHTAADIAARGFTDHTAPNATALRGRRVQQKGNQQQRRRTNKPKLFHGHPPSCSHSSPAGGLGAFVGRHGGMNPAGRARGRENMMPAYIGQPAGHEKGSATALSPPRSDMFSLKPVGRRTNSERFRSAPRTGRPLRGRLSVRQTD
jgi:hypothetical protein